MTDTIELAKQYADLVWQDGVEIRWEQLEAFRDAIEAPLLEKIAALTELLKNVIGEHCAPSDCYSSGPVNGDSRDFICPSCASVKYLAATESVTKSYMDKVRLNNFAEQVTRVNVAEMTEKLKDEMVTEGAHNECMRNLSKGKITMKVEEHIKTFLASEGIIVERDMEKPAEIRDGAPRLAISRRWSNDPKELCEYLKEVGHTKFAFLSMESDSATSPDTFQKITLHKIRFASW